MAYDPRLLIAWKKHEYLMKKAYRLADQAVLLLDECRLIFQAAELETREVCGEKALSLPIGHSWTANQYLRWTMAANLHADASSLMAQYAGLESESIAAWIAVVIIVHGGDVGVTWDIEDGRYLTSCRLSTGEYFLAREPKAKEHLKRAAPLQSGEPLALWAAILGAKIDAFAKARSTAVAD